MVKPLDVFCPRCGVSPGEQCQATHDNKCPLHYCKAEAPDDQALCAAHWKGLPREIQYELGRTYVRGMTIETATPGLLKAIHAASAFIQRDISPVREPDPGRWERLVRYVRARDAARARARGAEPPPNPSETPFRHLRLVP